MREKKVFLEDSSRELEYLRALIKNYGAHYLKSYFGFTLREIAQRMGIAKNTLSEFIQGRRRMQEKHALALSQVFKDLMITEKTKDVVETSAQMQIKEIGRKARRS